MTLEECKNMHKFGPFIKDNDNEFHRVCLCCKKVSYYPASLEINTEYKRQVDEGKIFDFIINQNFIDRDSDDFIRLIACLYGGLPYLYIDDSAKEKFIDKIESYNQYFNKDNIDRLNMVNEFLDYFDLFIKKEKLETKYGIGNFSDDDYLKLDVFGNSIAGKLDKELEKLYYFREKNKKSVKK